MNLKEGTALAPFTTFHIGGPARFFVEAHTEEEVHAALREAKEQGLPLIPLGGGSNVLVPDSGIEAVVLKMMMHAVVCADEADTVLIIAEAGARWDDVVNTAITQTLFGIENLAGIPGTVGGAAVQNIGAYGAELANIFEYADTIDTVTGARKRISRSESEFGYRTSFFKKNPTYIIIRVALRLTKNAQANLSYKDLARLHAAGTPLTTPSEIAQTVRGIRKGKFPQHGVEGTAGSFFKNPVLLKEQVDQLAKQYPDLPQFLQSDGTIKISLAWLLDHVLSLNGFSLGRARLYEKQPIVIATQPGATATEVTVLAEEVQRRVYDATGITIEREVETFGGQYFL